jgi:hypothetical protein
VENGMAGGIDMPRQIARGSTGPDSTAQHHNTGALKASAMTVPLTPTFKAQSN